MFNFPTQIHDLTLTVLLSWIYLFLDASFCSTMAFPPLEYSDHVVFSYSIDFLSNSQHDTLFHWIAYDYSHADWGSFTVNLRCSIGGYL